MPTFSYEIVKADINIQQVFERPLLDWDTAAKRFFGTVYDGLNKKYTVSPRDLSVIPGTTLGEVSSNYNIFGGASSIYLSADRITANFVGISTKDLETALDIQGGVQARFEADFPECRIKSVEMRWQGHVRLHDIKIVDFLQQFEVGSVKGALEKSGWKPNIGLRFRAVRAEPTGEFEMTAERSLAFEDALFISRAVVLKDIASNEPFDGRIAALVRLDEEGLRAANLRAL